MGASMRDPNFWKGQSKRYLAWGSWRFGIAFLVLAFWNVAPTLGNVVPALGNFKFWFFRFRSPDLSQSISHMRMPRITIKTHPPPLLGSISRKIFATSKCCRFLSARPLYNLWNEWNRRNFGHFSFQSSANGVKKRKFGASMCPFFENRWFLMIFWRFSHFQIWYSHLQNRWFFDDFRTFKSDFRTFKIDDFLTVFAPSNMIFASSKSMCLRKHHGAKRNGAAALRFIGLLQAQPGQ